MLEEDLGQRFILTLKKLYVVGQQKKLKDLSNGLLIEQSLFYQIVMEEITLHMLNLQLKMMERF